MPSTGPGPGLWLSWIVFGLMKICERISRATERERTFFLLLSSSFAMLALASVYLREFAMAVLTAGMAAAMLVVGFLTHLMEETREPNQ